MRFLLLHTPFKHFASAQPPLGLAYLKAVLKRKGVEAGVIDAYAERLTMDAIMSRVDSFNPDVVGLSFTTPAFDVSLTIANRVRSFKSVPILADSGQHRVRADGIDKFARRRH